MSTKYAEMLYTAMFMTWPKDLHRITTEPSNAETSGWKLFGLYIYCLLLVALAAAFVTLLVAAPHLIWPR